MNRIHLYWTQIQATDYSPLLSAPLMVIQNWSLSGSPSYPTQAPWVYRFLLNSGDFMVPALSSYGDLTNCTGPPTGCDGLPGQGSYSYPLTGSPLEKVFASHFIVQIPFASGNQYYDPSYGVTYPSAAGFETQAVAGYATQNGGDVSGSGNYHFRALSGTPDITFTMVLASSM